MGENYEFVEQTGSTRHDDTPYAEGDDGTHRPHVGDAIALFGIDLKEWF
jgi:hypothetical protein